MVTPYKITEDFETARVKYEKPKIIVSDFDETLAYTTPVFIKILKDKYKDTFKDYINIKDKYSESEILLRDQYMLNDYLNFDINSLPDNLKDKYNSIWSTENFYKMCKPSKYCIGLVNFAKHKLCDKIFIVSKSLSNEMIKQKKEFISHYFDKDSLHKIELLSLGFNAKKSDIIAKNHIKWNSLAEDKLEEIKDIVLNTESFGNEIIINRLGYNKMTEELSTTVQLFNLQVFYLKEIFNRHRIL